MGQWVTPVMGFLPANFKIPTPFYSTPRVRQTERRTDGETDNGHRCIMPTVWGPGMKKTWNYTVSSNFYHILVKWIIFTPRC